MQVHGLTYLLNLEPLFCLLHRCGDIVNAVFSQVRLNLISMQSDEKLKEVLTNLHQSLAARVCRRYSYRIGLPQLH